MMGVGRDAHPFSFGQEYLGWLPRGYLNRDQDDLRDLEQHRWKRRYKVADAPGLLGRPNPGLVKLVGLLHRPVSHTKMGHRM